MCDTMGLLGIWGHNTVGNYWEAHAVGQRSLGLWSGWVRTLRRMPLNASRAHGSEHEGLRILVRDCRFSRVPDLVHCQSSELPFRSTQPQRLQTGTIRTWGKESPVLFA